MDRNLKLLSERVGKIVVSVVLFRSSIDSSLFDSTQGLLVFPALTMVEEAPFRPREQLIEKQRLFQSIHKYTHLKSPMDKITSVAIPLALAGSSLFLIGRGIYNMSHGIGKKE
ncbi:hypothetical protein L1987_67532 [Smallanthus sonchifolius]|uniref:Uncharacterized protein n=1 Tax=Smallanthus sonchifolius TaxID=185202 RepID=A0ACB9B4Q1_9ASTR|nr:hypothetical protein L1987_67532 [Smallanthus sonchifolius]